MQLETPSTLTVPPPNWPPEVALILSAMNVADASGADRREHPRHVYQVMAMLRLFSDQSGDRPWTLYTRDANSRGIGFITPHRLPLGYGGSVELVTPAGRMVHIHCTLFRCREAVKGWYDGALYFNREQRAFEW